MHGVMLFVVWFIYGCRTVSMHDSSFYSEAKVLESCLARISDIMRDLTIVFAT